MLPPLKKKIKLCPLTCAHSITTAGVFFAGSDFNIADVIRRILDAIFILPAAAKRELEEALESIEHLLILQAIDTFEEAQIATCYDLEGFAGWNYDIADSLDILSERLLNFAKELDGLANRFPKIVLPIVGLVLSASLMYHLAAKRYRKAGLAAQTAHANLCLFRWAHPTPVH